MRKVCLLLIAAILIVETPFFVFAEDLDNGVIDGNKNEDEYELCEHEWDSWETYKAATIHKKGIKRRYCIECGEYQEKSIKKLKPFIKLTKKKTIKKGKSAKLKVKYARGDKVKKWTSSNKKIVKVNKKGKIKGIKPGKAWVKVKLRSGKTAKCRVTVKKAKKKTPHKKAKKSKKKGGSGTVYWTPSGKVYHVSRSCPTLSRSRTVYSGTIAQSHKPRCCKVCG